MTFSSLAWMLCLILNVNAQFCDGSLGENAFTEGDFGSGSANIVPTDPGIAPGYIYQTNPPPNDGFYTIASTTSPWASAFGGWLFVTDNSSDPNGYMMIVNASFDPGLFYEQTVTGLCEDAEYQFTADIINLIETGGNLILPNVTFQIDGVNFYTTGPIAENETWTTYGFSFNTAPGQTSVVLSLANNAPGGNGNDLALDNITFRPCGPLADISPAEVITICQDGSSQNLIAEINGNQYADPVFQWQLSNDAGTTWTSIPGATNDTYTHTDLTPGTYYYQYLLADGLANINNPICRVVSDLKIVEVIPKFINVTDTICEGLSSIIGTTEYSTTGIHTETLQNSLGCDSVVTLDLYVLPNGLEVTFTSTNPSCPESTDGSILLDQIIGGSSPYTFSVNQVFYGVGESLSNLAPGSYAIEIVDANGCTYSDELVLDPADPFYVSLGDDLSIELGETVSLTANTTEVAQLLTWGPANLVDCSDCETQEWFPPISANYYVQALSENGCYHADTVYIEVIEGVKDYFIPNAFTPNDDGRNDSFTIFGKSPILERVQRLSIYNRWGEAVYHATDFQPNDESLGWDGRYKGQLVNSGVYVYVSELRFLDRSVQTFTGNVTLIR